MNTPRYTPRPPRLLQALLLLSALAVNAQRRDLYVVVNRRAEFFRDRQLQKFHLEAGDVVEGEAHATYWDWLRILADGEPYDSRAKYFASRTSVREDLARTQADLISRVERNTDRIDSAREQISQYHSAIAAIRFDSTVEYRVRKIVPVDPRTSPPTGRKTVTPTGPWTMQEGTRVLPGDTRRLPATTPGATRRLPTAVPRATRRLPKAVPGTVRRITPIDPKKRPKGTHKKPLPSTPTGTTPRVRVTYSYMSKVSPGSAKSQARKWWKEVEKLEKSVRQWEEKRQQDVALFAASQSKMQAFDRRFRAYIASRRSQPLRPYLVTAEKTTLLDGKKYISQLLREDIVLGRPNQRFTRWLRIQTAERMLDGRAEHFASREALETEGAARVARLARLVADLQEEIAHLVVRERLLRTLSLSLEYESRLAQIPLTSYPFPTNYAGRTLYSGGFGPRDSVEMINGARARSVRREWERELKAVRAELNKERRRLATSRRDLAVTKAKVEDRNQRLRQAAAAQAAVPRGTLP